MTPNWSHRPCLSVMGDNTGGKIYKNASIHSLSVVCCTHYQPLPFTVTINSYHYCQPKTVTTNNNDSYQPLSLYQCFLSYRFDCHVSDISSIIAIITIIIIVSSHVIIIIPTPCFTIIILLP